MLAAPPAWLKVAVKTCVDPDPDVGVMDAMVGCAVTEEEVREPHPVISIRDPDIKRITLRIIAFVALSVPRSSFVPDSGFNACAQSRPITHVIKSAVEAMPSS
jgi:hypothetical protein